MLLKLSMHHRRPVMLFQGEEQDIISDCNSYFIRDALGKIYCRNTDGDFFPPKPWLADLDIPTSCFKMTLFKPVLFSTLNGASRT